ncbi:hypothetical protein V7O62_00455 [Methanolobus sp. ZRKC2]|uniref:hypothetical protein n=1 Tax=Methanolobus sp. ZRKC2 TaxID=3125783 RepID=UPI0032459DFC
MGENSVGTEFRICTKCGYHRGFHVYFKKLQEGKAKIGLICPNCGQSFDIGWITSDIPAIDPEKGQVFER